MTASTTEGDPLLVMDASGFSGTGDLTVAGSGSAIVFGASGSGSSLTDDGTGNAVLVGGPGSSTLSDLGTGRNILIGGGGGGSIAGDGKDILISGTTSYDADTSDDITALHTLLLEGSGSQSYVDRISLISSGVVADGVTYALDTATLQPDTVGTTVRDGSGATQNNWFIVSSLDTVTRKSNETETVE